MFGHRYHRHHPRGRDVESCGPVRWNIAARCGAASEFLRPVARRATTRSPRDGGTPGTGTPLILLWSPRPVLRSRVATVCGDARGVFVFGFVPAKTPATVRTTTRDYCCGKQQRRNEDVVVVVAPSTARPGDPAPHRTAPTTTVVGRGDE